MRTRSLLASFALATAVSASFAACRGPALEYDCDLQEQEFSKHANAEAQLQGYVPAVGPYAMAITFTEAGINELLAGLLESDIPFAGELQTGTVTVEFTPESAPTIRIADQAACENCVIYDIEFAVDVLSGGGAISSGLGAVEMQIPLKLAKLGEDSSALVADYSEMDLLDLELRVFGFDTEEHTSLGGALRILLEEELRERFSATELFKLDSWGLGSGDVELLARELKAFPELGTLSIGMGTNLDLGDTAFELDGSIGEDSEFGIRVAVGVFDRMARRMLHEGEIPRIYNEDGVADPGGNYAVTIAGITGEDDDNARLETRFRVWRLAFGYCGYAEIDMPVDLSIVPDDEAVVPTASLNAEAGTIQVVAGAGVGSVAARDDELVEDQEHLVDNFKEDLSAVLADTLDYSGLDLSGSRLWVVPLDVRVDDSSVYLDNDFLVLADPP